MVLEHRLIQGEPFLVNRLRGIHNHTFWVDIFEPSIFGKAALILILFNILNNTEAGNSKKK